MDQVQKILRELHDSLGTGGPPGFRRTWDKVRGTYYWCSLREDVRKWVSKNKHYEYMCHEVVLNQVRHRLIIVNPYIVQMYCANVWTERCNCSQPVIFQVDECPECQRWERVKTQAPVLHPIEVKGPWKVLGVDLIGPLPETRGKGKK